MIVCTSISPTHANTGIQLQCVKSWQGLGLKVYSFNHKSEIADLCKIYKDVFFVETSRTFELTYGKKLVAISAVLDWAKENDTDICLINSDIELKTDKETIERIKLKMNDNIVLANRIDYDDDEKDGKEYLLGIDVFFINKKILGLFPQSMHCFGVPFWDYFIPYTATKSGVNVIFIKQRIAYHKNHLAQYSPDIWKKSGRFFLWENGMYQFNDTTEIGKMSTFVYNFIYNSSLRIEI